MAQDTRKDPRARVLTMTVRYKSATIDEFIEHHSFDVSRGGIFIKTPSPFLPGTLLKFELRIADDKAMLQGVGRVVWKRDAGSSAADKPAGMGVKFIKVDEASRALIDRLIASQGGGVSAFDQESPSDVGDTPLGASATRPTALTPSPLPRPTPAAAASNASGVQVLGGPPRTGSQKYKGTMIGLGTESLAAAPAPAAPPAAPASPALPGAVASGTVTQSKSRPPRPDPMFPKTDSVGDMPPPEERTVMKQAAELLQEALRGAGGSLDEVGSAPARAGAVPAPKPSVPKPVQGVASPGPAPVAGSATGGASTSSAAIAESSAKGIASAPGSIRTATKEGYSTARSPSSGRQAASRQTGASAPEARSSKSSTGTATAVAVVPPAVTKKRPSAGMLAWSVLLVIGAGAAAYSVWQPRAVAPADLPTVPATPVTEVTPPPAPAPPVSAAVEAPAASAAIAAPAASGQAPSTIGSDGPAASAAPAVSASAAVPPAVPAAASVSPTPPPVVHAVQPTPPPPAPPAPRPPPPVAAPPAPKPPVVEAPPPAPKPAAVVVAPPKPRPAPPPPAAPKPPAKPSDDNPY